MTNDTALAAQVAKADTACVELHAAMLRMETELGVLKHMVAEIQLDRYETSTLFDGLRLLNGDIVPDSRHHEVVAAAS